MGVLVLDIGGTKLSAAAFDGHTLTCRREMATLAKEGPEAVLHRIYYLLDALRAACPAAKAIGLACPGPLSPSQGIVLKAPLMGWENLPLSALITRRYGLPVLLENDANAAAYSEWHQGAGRGCTEMVYITVSTGIGCGIVHQGHILSGHHEGAGELGHLNMVENGHACACGRRGCLEAYASGTAIAKAASQALGFPVAAREAAERARSGDTLCRAIFELAGSYLGRAIAALQQLIDPECIVMGGSVSKALDIMRPTLLQAAQASSYWAKASGHWLRTAQLQPDSGLIGAGLLAMNLEKTN